MDKMGKPAVERLIGKVHEHWPGDTLIQQAYSFIEKAYAGRMHPIGEPYIQYSLNVSLILAEISSDPATICAGLLYHLLSATSMSLKDIRKAFGDEVAGLVHGVTELGRLEWDVLQEEEEGKKEELRRAEILQKMLLIAINEPKEKGQAVNFQKEEKQTENLRRMLLAMASEDIRALIIELADHLHLMRNLDALAVDEKQRILAKEALKVHAPLADRLGIWQLKWELEDLAFRHLQPDEYKRIADQLAVKRETRERYIANVISVLQEELERVGIRAEIDGRVKHIYSIHRKIERKELAFEQINDLLGVRVIVGTDSDCYSALGILHSIWSPVTSIYDGKAGRDWIVNPKDNLYQSFHTTVDAIDGKQLEVQIRTHKMHEVAEYGVAAHWRYEKKRKSSEKIPKEEQAWGEQLAALRTSLADKPISIGSFQTRLSKDWVFVITPEGHIIDLVAGATPLDFAYRIHTDLGHKCVGAKVNGRLARFNHQLKNGEIVEIVTSKARKGPNPDWLSKRRGKDGKEDYVYVKTSHAREKIRQWFRQQQSKRT